MRIPILIVIVLIIFSSLSKGFFTLRTLNSVLSLMSAYGTIAIGQTLVILIGGLDVSVGGILAISGLLMIKLMPYGAAIAIPVSLLSGVFIGFINGLIITRFKVNSLITTIGMGFLLGGVAYLISDGTIHLKDHPIVSFGNGSIMVYTLYSTDIYSAHSDSPVYSEKNDFWDKTILCWCQQDILQFFRNKCFKYRTSGLCAFRFFCRSRRYDIFIKTCSRKSPYRK